MMRIFVILCLCSVLTLAMAQEGSTAAAVLPASASPQVPIASSLPVPLSPKENKHAATAFSMSDLFAKYQSGIYQIRVINQATGQKTSIGSGFVIGDGTLLATNYHVVSDAVQKENRVLQYVDTHDKEGHLTLLGVDVVHDLAIVKADKPLGTPFTFAPIPAQGAPLYALGNPHDLGFVIVDGINNGLLKKSARERILFSGALNAGMSGGPTLNREGAVVGVNVAYLRQGNDISFIIPSRYLETLLKQVSAHKQVINQSIAMQLFADNEHYYGNALHKQWPMTTIGHFKVPLAMHDDVRCWDSSPSPDVDDLLGVEGVTCFSDRATFISDDVVLGQMAYAYSYFYPREDMLGLRFYHLYSHYYKTNMQPRPQRDYEDIHCRADFISIANRPFKTTFCIQPSRKFALNAEPIEDMRLLAAEIGEKNQGFIIEIGINGVQDKLGRRVIAHILKQIQWVK